MAKSLSNSATFGALLCLFFLLLSSQGVQMVEAKLCERRSETWTGWCAKTSHTVTNNARIGGAEHGACHGEFPGEACFCYFECSL
ncbi:defensin-like protein 19 [Prunus yedoensis var. nudiflora]|uniref:Defensin-like protein 19 n=1 Tax=Prunus yedoensis var. nudiflora TaxID=2094558 RepID=A0A314Y305_PRUYE|nr:defensin-like protein 19 [Prunus yedoensis var. nudiflora]